MILSRAATRICNCLSYCTFQINHAIKKLYMKQVFWLIFQWLIFSGLHKVQVHLKLLMHKICYILYILLACTSRSSLKVINVIKENINVKKFCNSISSSRVQNLILLSTTVTFELSKHKYFTFIIKLNNKIGTKNKIKSNLSYIVKIDNSRLNYDR